MVYIKKIITREVLESRGEPAPEIDLWLDDGSFGRFTVPAGASVGEHEAIEIRDNDLKRYHGKGVLNVLGIIEKRIKPVIIKKNFDTQEELDKFLIELDGSENKSNLGANSILGISVAFAKAFCSSKKIPFWSYANPVNEKKVIPVPMMNFLNGGVHGQWVTDLQEYMIMPIGAANFREALRWCSEVYHSLKGILKEKNYSIGVGDEGGFSVREFKDNTEPLDLLMQAIKESGYEPGREISIALDAAASAFYDKNFSDKPYNLKRVGKRVNAVELVDFYKSLIEKYPIISIEDGLGENDWEGWGYMSRKLKNIQLVGDDLFVTNPKIFGKGIGLKVGNSILVKLNQIGTLSETCEVIKLAMKNDYSAVISHRSAQTEDPVAAHLAVAFNTGQIKYGSVRGYERTNGYNELLRIEESLGDKCVYGGEIVRKRLCK